MNFKSFQIFDFQFSMTTQSQRKKLKNSINSRRRFFQDVLFQSNENETHVSAAAHSMCTALEHGFAKTKHWEAHTNSRAYIAFAQSQSVSQTARQTHTLTHIHTLFIMRSTYTAHCRLILIAYRIRNTLTTTSGYLTHVLSMCQTNDRMTKKQQLRYVHTVGIRETLCQMDSD